MTTAIVLAGHGSHISPETAGLVWAHVDALRQLHIADEVTAAFWKEMPSFHTVFDSLTADDITVVPLFTAQGYFTQTVIPAEMGLTGTLTQRAGRTIHYTRTLSEHPYLGKVVQQRVEDAMQWLNITPEQTAVALVGHSTRRNPESRKATEAQADAIRRMGLAAEVVAVYLDDTPAIADVYTLTSLPNLIVVPYFLANGSHTTIDVPRELGLDAHKQEVAVPINGRSVYYTQPIGIQIDLLIAILELIHEADPVFIDKGPKLFPILDSTWDCFPCAALPYIQRLMQSLPFVVGQLRVTADDVRHVEDTSHPTDTITEPAVLRQRVRENPFRPLATSTDLPRGWHVPTHGDPQRVLAVIETVYPGVLGSSLTLPSSLDALVNRQTGRYRELSQLDAAGCADVVQQVCGNCIRQPIWAVTNPTTHRLNCPEPCDVWLSAAMNLVKGSEAV